MDLMGDIRNMLARGRKALGIDITPSEQGAQVTDDPLRPAAEPEPAQTSGDPSETGTTRAETGTTRATGAADRFTQDSILSSLRDLKDRVEQQFTSARDLMNQFRRMPHDLEQLPELVQHNARTLASISDRLDQSRSDREFVKHALEQLQKSLQQHAATLESLQQQVDSHGRSVLRLVDALDDLEPHLSRFAQSEQQMRDAIAQLGVSASSRETQTLHRVEAVKRFVIVAVSLSAVAAIAAVAALLILIAE